MRRLLFLLTLIAILILVVYLNRISDTWRYVVPAEPGQVIYATTFEDATDWDLQDRRGGLITLGDEALRLQLDEANARLLSTTRFYYEDFDLRVQARAVGGPVDNSFGVVFRQQDPDTYYTFLISSDGFYRVARASGGLSTILISNWIDTPLIQQGVNGLVNDLRVVGRGDTFQFYINGQLVQLCLPDAPDGESTYFLGECVDGTLVDHLVDDRIPFGKVGVAVETLSEPGVTVEFDNILVLGPEQDDNF